uniref:DNA ligase 1-like n=1 Tax=Caenorhabditis tropicalis TaxID=1561998 RepID=A0A1I7TKI2_9PELO
MSKRQSSLMSFFTKKPKAETSEENIETKEIPLLKGENKKEAEKKVLKRTNSQTVSTPTKAVKNTPKRARVVVSSSSEGEDDSKDEDFKMKEDEASHESSEESDVDENASDDCEVTYESTPQSTPKNTPKRSKKLTKTLAVTPKSVKATGSVQIKKQFQKERKSR